MRPQPYACQPRAPSFAVPAASVIFSSAFVYFVMLELRPPHRPLSDVTATVVDFPASAPACGHWARLSRCKAGTRPRERRSQPRHLHAPLLLCAPRTWVVAKEADKRVHDAPRLLHRYLRVLHFGCSHHLHGLCDLADVLDGPDALLDCRHQPPNADVGSRRSHRSMGTHQCKHRALWSPRSDGCSSNVEGDLIHVALSHSPAWLDA